MSLIGLAIDFKFICDHKDGIRIIHGVFFMLPSRAQRIGVIFPVMLEDPSLSSSGKFLESILFLLNVFLTSLFRRASVDQYKNSEKYHHSY